MPYAIRKNLYDMRPRQLCRQCRHNLKIWKQIRESHHSADVSFLKTFCSKFILQLSRHCHDNLFSIFYPFISKHFAVYSLANVPIHQGKFSIDIHCNTVTGFINYLSQIIDKRCYFIIHMPFFDKIIVKISIANTINTLICIVEVIFNIICIKMKEMLKNINISMQQIPYLCVLK